MSCSAGAPSTCSISPSSVTPTAAGASFTVTVNSATAGTFHFNIMGVGSDSLHIAHSAPTTLIVNPDFTISNTSGTQSVLSGQTAIFLLNIAPVGGSTFGSTVTYSCSGLPPLVSCNFNPASISGSSGITVVTLSITTVGPGAAQKRLISRILLPFGVTIVGLFFGGLSQAGKRRRYAAFGIALIVALSGFLIACGGGNGSTTPPPPVVNVQISPTSATLFTGQTKQFSASVTGTNNTAVNWLVNGVTGGSATSGTIDSSGLYTTPGTAPGSSVTVSAVSQADTTKSSSANVIIQSPTASGSYPITVTAMLNGVQHYTILTLNVQ